MVTKRRFTEEEDRVILSKISENPNNLTQCFRELSVELDRSFYSLSSRWYYVLAKKDKNSKNNTVFVTYGKNNVNPNRKVSVPNSQQPVRVKKSKWRRILDILFK